MVKCRKLVCESDFASEKVSRDERRATMFTIVTDDILEIILKFCSILDLCRLEIVCKEMQQVLKSSNIWENVYNENFGAYDSFTRGTKSFKDLCVTCYKVKHFSKKKSVAWQEVKPNDDELLARQGAAMDSTLDGKGAYLFGGWTLHGIQTDCWFFENQTKTWKFLGIGASLIPLYGHRVTSVSVSEKDGASSYTFLLTGGITQPGYLGASNGTVLFYVTKDLSQTRCARLRPTFDVDQEGHGVRRGYHTTTTIFESSLDERNGNSQLFLFGGFDEDGSLTAPELYDIESNTFIDLSAVQSGSVPSPRFGHSTVSIKDAPDKNILLVSGGTPEANNMKYEDPDSRDHEDMHILEICRTDTKEGWKYSLSWTKIGHPLLPPIALMRLHSATKVGTDQIIFFGGGRPDLLSKSCYSLHIPKDYKNFEKWTVKEICVDSSKAPRSRQDHKAAWLRNETLLIFGGCVAEPRDEELNDTWLLPLV